MDDSELVCRFERVRDLTGHRQRFGYRDRSAIDHGRQVLTLDQLHHQCSVVGAGFSRPFLQSKYLRDVRMVQRGECLRFAGEASQPLGVRREQFGQDLDRDAAIELRVTRAIDLAHAAFAKGREDFIWPEPAAG